MKNLLRLLAFALAASAANVAAAQNNPPPRAQFPAGLTAGGATWVHVPIIFDNYLMVGSGGGARGRGSLSRDPSTPPHVASAIAQARGHFSDAGRSQPARTTSPDGGWRWASVELTYAGAKRISRVHLDFVFTDPQTGAEVLRLSYHTSKRLRAGQTRLFRKEFKATETNRRGDGARLGVEIREVVYADGSVWTSGN